MPSPGCRTGGPAPTRPPKPQGRRPDHDRRPRVDRRRRPDPDPVDRDAVRGPAVLHRDAVRPHPDERVAAAQGFVVHDETGARRATHRRHREATAGGCGRHPGRRPRRGRARAGSAAAAAGQGRRPERRPRRRRRAGAAASRRRRRAPAPAPGSSAAAPARRGARPARHRASATVDRTDHSTTTSTGWGRRRGTCTVSVISMAATVGRPTDDAAELSTGQHLGVRKPATSGSLLPRGRWSAEGSGRGRRGRGCRPHARGRGA